MNLSILTSTDLEKARQTIIKLLEAYEFDAIVALCDSKISIDIERMSELRDKILNGRGILRDIASAEARLEQFDKRIEHGTWPDPPQPTQTINNSQANRPTRSLSDSLDKGEKSRKADSGQGLMGSIRSMGWRPRTAS